MFTFSKCPPNELAAFVASVTHNAKEAERSAGAVLITLSAGLVPS